LFLSEAIEWRKSKKSQAYKGKGDETIQKIGNCAEIGHALKIIFGNPVFDLVTLAGAIEIGIVTAFAAFLPKIIQFQFGQTTSMAAFVAGQL
jgi:organic anion transporter 4A